MAKQPQYVDEVLELSNLKKWQWPFHIMMHPFEGYENLRWKKSGSMIVAWVIVFLYFFVQVCDKLFTCFVYNNYTERVFNVVPTIVQTIVLFIAWVIGNWAVGTFLNGEGSMKNICIFSAYALVPKIIGDAIAIGMSNIIVENEEIFMNLIQIVFTAWTVLLLFMAIKVVHQYKFGETIAAIILTIAAILIMLFLAVLLLSIFQKLYVFCATIYTEIVYRFSV